MNKKITAIAFVLGAGLSWAVLRQPPTDNTMEEIEEGVHGGRLLQDGALSVEMTIFERGVLPEFRVFVYADGKAIAPESVDLAIELIRFGGRVDKVGFSKREDYLVGDREIVEPHSFDVKVAADYKGKASHWEYESHEGRTSIAAEAAKQSGIEIDKAGPANIKTTIRVNGRVTANEDHWVHVVPRYPGIVKKASKRLGDPVRKGDVMAVVESNQSLQPYTVRSSIAGTVVFKDVASGEYAKEGETIYTVADLSSVWVDFDVYRQDFDKLSVGQAVTISTSGGKENVAGAVSYLSPIGAEGTQTTLARVELPNPDGQWRPGLFVTGQIVVEEASVPVAVEVSGLQTYRNWDVVFMQEGDVYEIAILELGRRDDRWAEVISGISLGQKYATENSFILKADVGKSGASHDH